MERNKEFLQLKVLGSKTLTGANYQADARKVIPKVWATGHPTRCPVTLFRQWLSHRPSESCSPHSPLFLAVRRPCRGNIWYKNGPLGEKQFSKMWSSACSVAEIPKKTGHAGRKTLMKAMGKADVPDHYQVQVSGHKNTDSIRQYNTLDDDEQFLISSVLTKTMSDQQVAKRSEPQPSTSSSSLWRDNRTDPHWLEQNHVVQNQVLTNERIYPAGNMFSNCTFSGCTFYTGPAQPEQ